MANDILPFIKESGLSHDEVKKLIEEYKSKQQKNEKLMPEEEALRKKELEEQKSKEQKRKEKEEADKEEAEKAKLKEKANLDNVDISDLTKTLVSEIRKEVKQQLKMKRQEPPTPNPTDKGPANLLTKNMFETVV